MNVRLPSLTQSTKSPQLKSFFRAAAIYNIFWRLHTTSWGAKPSALFFPDESCVRVEEKVTYESNFYSFKESLTAFFRAAAQHRWAESAPLECDWGHVWLPQSSFAFLLCALIVLHHTALHSYWFIGVNSQVFSSFGYKWNLYCVSLMNTWSCLQLQFPAAPNVLVL